MVRPQPVALWRTDRRQNQPAGQHLHPGRHCHLGRFAEICLVNLLGSLRARRCRAATRDLRLPRARHAAGRVRAGAQAAALFAWGQRCPPALGPVALHLFSAGRPGRIRRPVGLPHHQPQRLHGALHLPRPARLHAVPGARAARTCAPARAAGFHSGPAGRHVGLWRHFAAHLPNPGLHALSGAFGFAARRHAA